MIILDTNVISEFMTSPPAGSVLNWLNKQQASNLYLSSVSVAEITFGLRIMPEGNRKKALAERFEQFIKRVFDQRILPFDEDAARIYGDILGHRKELGRPISNFDGQITAIARVKGFSIATRNIKDFTECGVDLINPFST